MRRLYLILALIGLVVPYAFFISFLAQYGLNFGELWRQLTQNSISLFAWADVVVTAVVFLIWSRHEAHRVNVRVWPLTSLVTLLVGPSCALPLFLFFRQRAIEAHAK